MAQDSSVKPYQYTEFQHTCVVKGVQTTARSRLSRLMTLGSHPSLSYKVSRVSHWLEVRLRWLEDAIETRQESLLATSSSHPCLRSKVGSAAWLASWKHHTRPLSAAEQWKLMLRTPSMISLLFLTKQTLLITLLSSAKREQLSRSFH